MNTCKQLDGKEAFAWAVAAGVPVTSEVKDGMLCMVLAHPVAVFRDGDTIKVFHREQSSTKEVLSA